MLCIFDDLMFLNTVDKTKEQVVSDSSMSVGKNSFKKLERTV